MEDIYKKYTLLDKQSKKEIRDLIDFLLFKKKKRKPSPLSLYKKKILRVSQWSDEDIEHIEQNQTLLRGWKPKDW